jgi:hypothetical protein
MCEWGSPLEWNSRPPYMASGLGFPFEVGGRLQIRKVSFRDYREDLAPRTYWRCRTAIFGRNLRHKPVRSSGVWMRSSEVFQGRRGCG